MNCELCGNPEPCALNFTIGKQTLLNRNILDSVGFKAEKFKDAHIFSDKLNSYESSIVLAMVFCNYYRAKQESQNVTLNNTQIESVKDKFSPNNQAK